VRLTVAAHATADDQGAVVFLLDPPPPGKVWTGNLAVVAASAGARFQAQLGNGLPLGEWVGPVSFGPAQAMPGEQLTVIGSGLTAGAAYTLSLVGEQTAPELAPTVYPMPSPAPQQRSSLGYQLLDLMGFPGASYPATYGPFDVSAFDGIYLHGFADDQTASGRGVETMLTWSASLGGDVVANQFFSTLNHATISPGLNFLSTVVPVLAPWLTITTFGGPGTMLGSTVAGLTAPLPKHGALFGQVGAWQAGYTDRLITKANLGAGVSSAALLSRVSPGPWQFNVFTGLYNPGASTPNVAWELLLFEMDRLGNFSPIASIDGTARATQAAKTETVELGAMTVRAAIVNRSAAAADFTVTATLAGGLV
jgi:hypothetical protein